MEKNIVQSNRVGDQYYQIDHPTGQIGRAHV